MIDQLHVVAPSVQRHHPAGFVAGVVRRHAVVEADEALDVDVGRLDDATGAPLVVAAEGQLEGVGLGVAVGARSVLAQRQRADLLDGGLLCAGAGAGPITRGCAAGGGGLLGVGLLRRPDGGLLLRHGEAVVRALAVVREVWR